MIKLKFSSGLKNKLLVLTRNIERAKTIIGNTFLKREKEIEKEIILPGEIHSVRVKGTIYLDEKEKEMKRRIKVSSAKAKARWLQNWTCEQISKILNIPWGYEDDKLIQPRIMGQSGVDVILRGKAQKEFPFSVEDKSSETWRVVEAIRQAKNNQKKNTEWLLFFKKIEFKNPVVIMDGYAFFRLIEELKCKKNEVSILLKDTQLKSDCIKKLEKE